MGNHAHSRDLQRRARDYARKHGIAYQKALDTLQRLDDSPFTPDPISLGSIPWNPQVDKNMFILGDYTRAADESVLCIARNALDAGYSVVGADVVPGHYVLEPLSERMANYKQNHAPCLDMLRSIDKTDEPTLVVINTPTDLHDAIAEEVTRLTNLADVHIVIHVTTTADNRLRMRDFGAFVVFSEADLMDRTRIDIKDPGALFIPRFMPPGTAHVKTSEYSERTNLLDLDIRLDCDSTDALVQQLRRATWPYGTVDIALPVNLRHKYDTVSRLVNRLVARSVVDIVNDRAIISIKREPVTILGHENDGSPIEWDYWNNPHLLIVGGSGTGKSEMAADIFDKAVASGWATMVADRNGNSGQLWTSRMKHAIAGFASSQGRGGNFGPGTSLDDIRRLLNNAIQVMTERQEVLAQFDVTNIDALDSDLRPPRLLVVIDAYPIGLPDIQNQVEQLTRQGRSAGVHVLATCNSGPGIHFVTREFSAGILTGLISDYTRNAFNLGDEYAERFSGYTTHYVADGQATRFPAPFTGTCVTSHRSTIAGNSIAYIGDRDDAFEHLCNEVKSFNQAPLTPFSASRYADHCAALVITDRPSKWNEMRDLDIEILLPEDAYDRLERKSLLCEGEDPSANLVVLDSTYLVGDDDTEGKFARNVADFNGYLVTTAPQLADLTSAARYNCEIRVIKPEPVIDSMLPVLPPEGENLYRLGKDISGDEFIKAAKRSGLKVVDNRRFLGEISSLEEEFGPVSDKCAGVYITRNHISRTGSIEGRREAWTREAVERGDVLVVIAGWAPYTFELNGRPATLIGEVDVLDLREPHSISFDEGTKRIALFDGEGNPMGGHFADADVLAMAASSVLDGHGTTRPIPFETAVRIANHVALIESEEKRDEEEQFNSTLLDIIARAKE